MKKGRLFSKFSSIIALAARDGSDLAMNAKLRVIVDKAKASGMNKEAITRAIKRGSGELGGNTIEEVQLEAYGPNGSGILITCATDNKNRTIAKVRNLLSTNNLKPADSGSVLWMFDEVGQIEIDKSLFNEDLELQLIELGAKDIVVEDDVVYIITEPKELNEVKGEVEKIVKVNDFSLVFRYNQGVELSEKECEKLVKAIEEIEENDDVLEVYTNVI
jgi:YebC/PmpR family DNA-binding regulatory protein